MSPAGLYHFLHNEDSPLSEKQIQAIQEMGFGSLLLLQIKKVPGSLAYWLVSNYNPIKGCLLDGKLPILEEDIYLSLGLPMGPNVVIEASNGDKCPVYLSVLEKFKSQFGNDSIDVKDILAKLPTKKEGGDDFKRNFIIYIFSALLGGVVGNQASLKLLKSLANTDSISDFNWCNFIKRKLADQVQSWQKEEFETKQLKENWFGGPIMALVFVYLDRSVFKSRLVSRQFPTLSTWTTEAILKRINDELNDKNSKTRTFGRGSVEPPLVMSQHMPLAPSSLLKIDFRQTSKSLGAPSSEHQSVKQSKQQQPEQQQSEHAETAAPAVSSNSGSASEFVDKFAESAKVLAQAFLQYKSLASHAPSKLHSSPTVDKLVAAADGMAEGFRLSQQEKCGNEDNRKDEDNGKTVEVKEIVDNEEHEQNEENILSCNVENIAENTERITGWSEADLLAALEIMDEAFQPIQPHHSPPKPECPSFRLLPLDDHLLSQPEEFLSQPQPQPQPETEPQRQPETEPQPEPSTSYGEADQPESDQAEPEPDHSEPTVEVDLVDITQTPAVYTRRGVRVKTARNKRPTVPAEVYRSPYLQRNTNILKDFTQAEKNCLDNVDVAAAQLILTPIIAPSCPPFLFCFDLRPESCKCQIIHPMKDISVDYTPFHKPMQDRLINLLQSKLPSVTCLTSMAMPEVFVPKSILKCNQIDNGLYLLNILENYKGNKTNSLTTVNTEAQLRRFALWVCHQIATCSGNLSKEIVKKDALELSSSLGLPFTDKELVTCVGRRTKAIAQ
ncbi:hypothetical protein KSS87_002941 [Heliosperma pusillum]|nr:hypothetical protein KSS87_002941 [Heliosperma pusillum]